MSLMNGLARNLLWLAPRKFASRERISRRFLGKPPAPPADIPALVGKLCRITRETIDGQEVVTLTPHQGFARQIVYLHGGAYISPIRGVHWKMIAAIIARTGAQVVVPLYHRAPAHDYHAAGELALKVVSQLGQGPVFLAGDSAGGNLVMATVLRMRDAGAAPPAGLILFSPWLDLTLADPKARQLEAKDPMLRVEGLRQCGLWWAGDKDPADPVLSPLYADLTGLPPMAVFQGGHDIFLSDTRRFVAKARDAGVAVEYVEEPGGFHVYMALTFTPEARHALDLAARFIARDSRAA